MAVIEVDDRVRPKEYGLKLKLKQKTLSLVNNNIHIRYKI